jgi:tRNA-specific 2-thiouridylase
MALLLLEDRIHKMKIVVGMSGGVDSAVSALLLKEQGHEVIGLFMKNWEEEEGACHALEDYEDVVKVCEQLKSLLLVSFAKGIGRTFSPTFSKSQASASPNPDVLCTARSSLVAFDKGCPGADALPQDTTVAQTERCC